MSRAGTRASTLLDLLVGTTLALAVLAGLTAVVGSGARVLLGSGARAEAEDTAALAVEALTFDLRRAGYDPAAAGTTSVTEARADGLALTADLDGDGVVDPASEERVRYQYAAGSRRLSRIVGNQSLPLADGVAACGFTYLDADGVPFALPAGGLDAGARARVRAIALDLALRPSGLSSPARRSALVALRTVP